MASKYQHHNIHTPYKLNHIFLTARNQRYSIVNCIKFQHYSSFALITSKTIQSSQFADNLLTHLTLNKEIFSKFLKSFNPRLEILYWHSPSSLWQEMRCYAFIFSNRNHVGSSTGYNIIMINIIIAFVIIIIIIINIIIIIIIVIINIIVT